MPAEIVAGERDKQLNTTSNNSGNMKMTKKGFKVSDAKIKYTANKIVNNWSGSEQSLIRIASKQKKPINSYGEAYLFAKKQIEKELKQNPKKLEEEYEFYKEMEH